MKASEAVEVFTELFATLYDRTYRRRDPRTPRLSGEAIAMLQHLHDSGPLSATEAARHFDRSQAAISERFERLIRRGLLERLPDDRDRRRHLFWITDKGEALLAEELSVLDRELLSGAMQAMKDKERDALIQGMRALVDAANPGDKQPKKGMKR